MTRHFLRDDDITPAEQQEILDLAESMKSDRWGERPLAGPQTVAVIFDKSSTRTRVSFAVGIADLGGQPLIISTANSQLGGKETPSDTARVLERMVAAIGARGRYSEANFKVAKAELLKWIQTDNDLEAIGKPYAVYWNGPITPWFLKKFEVQVKVRRKHWEG